MDQAEAMRFGQSVGNFDGDLEQFARRQRTFLQTLRECFAFEKFHDQEVDAGLRANVIEVADVGMSDGGERAGFAFEAALKFGVAGKMGGQDFDGNAAVETGVARAVDFAHAASADGRDDLVRAESAFCRQVHAGADYSAVTKPSYKRRSQIGGAGLESGTNGRRKERV